MIEVFVLLILFQLKHFLADYPLQTAFMLQKFKDKGWAIPLAAHAGIHALLTFIIALWFSSRWPFLNWKISLIVAVFDFTIHFTMDRIKASPHLLGRFKTLTAAEYSTATEAQKRGNRFFWWSLGLDQMVHHLTHYAIIFILISY